jgi:hypothetical protein
MKCLKLIFSLFLITFFVSVPKSEAGLLIEPLVGFSTGNIDDGTDDISSKGLSFGGRLGYQNLGFQLGVDYLNSTLDLEDVPSDYQISDWAAFIGYKFPIMLRVYAGYILNSVATTEYQNVETKFEKGNGTKIGIGFTGLPFVNINLEMRQGNWDEVTSGNLSVEQEIKYKIFMLGVSVPFTL